MLLEISVGVIIVCLLRLLVPLTIFKYPLWGTVASLIIDGLDVVIAFFLGATNMEGYHNIDKVLDVYYLSFAFLVSMKWDKMAKITSMSLFIYRIIGVILFEITQIRLFLFIFNNLFENFFIFEAARQKYFPKFKLTVKRLVIALLILLIPKMIQEYILHYLELKPAVWMGTKLGLIKS
jgi:hypothetical protein